MGHCPDIIMKKKKRSLITRMEFLVKCYFIGKKYFNKTAPLPINIGKNILVTICIKNIMISCLRTTLIF